MGPAPAHLLALHVPRGHKQGHAPVREITGQLIRPYQGPTRQQAPPGSSCGDRPIELGIAADGPREGLGAGHTSGAGSPSQSWSGLRTLGANGGSTAWRAPGVQGNPPCPQLYRPLASGEEGTAGEIWGLGGPSKGKALGGLQRSRWGFWTVRRLGGTCPSSELWPPPCHPALGA